MLPSWETLRIEFWPQALDVLLKLGFAVLLGGAIGLEREVHGRPAGVRTHMLVCLGVTLFSEVSKAFMSQDPSRIAAQIVTGIGFLGAGSILRMGAEIRGLTTAASIWSAAAIGMAVSVGGYFYVVALVATVLALITLTVVENLERKFATSGEPRRLHIGIVDRSHVPAVLEEVETKGGVLVNVQIEKAASGYLLMADLKKPDKQVLARVAGLDGVESAHWGE